MRFSHHYVFAFCLFLCTEDSFSKKFFYEALTLNGHCIAPKFVWLHSKIRSYIQQINTEHIDYQLITTNNNLKNGLYSDSSWFLNEYHTTNSVEVTMAIN